MPYKINFLLRYGIMAVLSLRKVVLGSVFTLSACSFSAGDLFPPVSDEPPAPASHPVPVVEVTDASFVVADAPAADASVYYAAPVSAPAPAPVVNAPVVTTSGARIGTMPNSGMIQTVPGRKIAELGDELMQLKTAVNKHANTLEAIKSQIAADAAKYHETIGAVTSKLQVGTTRGNPIMVENWNYATYLLDSVNQNVILLGQLSSDASADEATASYLLDSIRATYDMSGAIDEDHERLREVEKGADELAIAIKKMVSNVNETLLRQQQYIANERRNLGTLSLAIRDGQLYGKSLSDPMVAVPAKRINQGARTIAPKADNHRDARSVAANSASAAGTIKAKPAAATAGAGANAKAARAASVANAKPKPVRASVSKNASVAKSASVAGTNAKAKLDSRRPLMIIRFDRKDLGYEPALYQTAKKALERKPDVEFEIVAVIPVKNGAPLAINEARKNADGVRMALINMGFPDERLLVTETENNNIEISEVRLFVR